jgi:hypothetical protein
MEGVYNVLGRGWACLRACLDIHKLYTMLRYFTWRAFSFWRVISILTDLLIIIAFVLRIWGLYAPDDDRSSALKLESFQVLSCVSPLIWMSMCYYLVLVASN